MSTETISDIRSYWTAWQTVIVPGSVSVRGQGLGGAPGPRRPEPPLGEVMGSDLLPLYKGGHVNTQSEDHPMKRFVLLAVVALLLVTGCSGIATADENYHGEDGEQPAPGADDSAGPGAPNSDTARDAGDRTRHKDR